MPVLYKVIRCNLKYFQFSHETSLFNQENNYSAEKFAYTNSDVGNPVQRFLNAMNYW